MRIPSSLRLSTIGVVCWRARQHCCWAINFEIVRQIIQRDFDFAPQMQSPFLFEVVAVKLWTTKTPLPARRPVDFESRPFGKLSALPTTLQVLLIRVQELRARLRPRTIGL